MVTDHCPRCDWEPSYEPPLKLHNCPMCNYPDPDPRDEEPWWPLFGTRK